MLDSWMAFAISRWALTARRATRYRFLPPSRSRLVMPFPTLTFVTGKPRGRTGKPWLENLWRQGNVHPLIPLPFLPPCHDVLLFRGMRARRNALWDGEFRFPRCVVCYRFFFVTVNRIKVHKAFGLLPSQELLYAFRNVIRLYSFPPNQL